MRAGTPWKGDAPVDVGGGTAGLSSGMGEVTTACAGQATARAGFRDTLNSSVSGWASGQSTVIRVRPGPERRGPDSPRAWSLQRGRGQVGRG